MLQQPAWLPGTIPGSIDTSRIRSVSSQCGVSAMAVLMLRTLNQGQGSDWSVRGGIDTGPLVGDVQCSIWPMTPVEPSAPPVSVTRVGRVMALRKRNQTQQAEKNQNFKYHFHIKPYHSPIPLLKLIKKWYIPLFSGKSRTLHTSRGSSGERRTQQGDRSFS